MGKILVVDPSLLDRKRMRNILEAAGHSVMELGSIAEAMTELQNQPLGSIRLVLTELHYPGDDGLGFIRWMKRQPKLTSLPILVVTQQPPREILIDLVVTGVSTIVAKPFGSDQLLRRVTETLNEQDAMRQGEGDSLSWPITDYLRRELKRAERSGNDFSLVVCQVADPMGGRAVPQLMGSLVHLMRESDVLARLGDDSVVVLLPDTDSIGASVVETRIWKAVQSPVEDQGDRVLMPLKVTTGAATFPAEAGSAEALLLLARDRASAGG